MKYGIDTRTIFSLTRYQMLAYCWRTKKFIVKVPPVRIGRWVRRGKRSERSAGERCARWGTGLVPTAYFRYFWKNAVILSKGIFSMLS